MEKPALILSFLF